MIVFCVSSEGLSRDCMGVLDILTAILTDTRFLETTLTHLLRPFTASKFPLPLMIVVGTLRTSAITCTHVDDGQTI